MLEKWMNKKEETEKVLEKIDLGNGLEMVRRISNGEMKIQIEKDGADIMDLISLAPDGTCFKYDKSKRSWGADRGESGYVIFVEKLKDTGSLLSLLHEIGHLQYPEDLDIISTLKAKSYNEAKRDDLERFPAPRLKAIKEKFDTTIRVERDAWAYALKQARKLEHDFDVDIFNNLPGEGDRVDRAKNFINYCLKRYEDYQFEELYNADIFSREQLDKHLAFLEEKEAHTKQ